MCTRAVGVLAHYFEEEGIPTTQISLIRDHTERLRPPRALWVPFELGRPFGEPLDPEFQQRVIREALSLFDAPSGPLLVDFPDEAPGASVPDGGAGWACPLPRPAREGATDAVAAFRREFDGMLNWYALGLEKRGRTTVGVSRMKPDELVRFISAFAGPTTPEVPDGSPALAFKHAMEDLKTLYGEAALAKPAAKKPNGSELAGWFWNETHAGALLRELHTKLLCHEDAQLRMVAEIIMVPEEQL